MKTAIGTPVFMRCGWDWRRGAIEAHGEQGRLLVHLDAEYRAETSYWCSAGDCEEAPPRAPVSIEPSDELGVMVMLDPALVRALTTLVGSGRHGATVATVARSVLRAALLQELSTWARHP